MIGIYKISNSCNSNIYIGQSIDIERRWSQHLYEALHPRNNNLLYNAMRKYGIENFYLEVIEECLVQELDDREIYWISYYNSFHNGYNMTPGGQSEGSKLYDINYVRMMWDDGLSVGDIITILGCNKSTVYNYLKDYENYSPDESRKRGRIALYHPELVSSKKEYYFLSDESAHMLGIKRPIHQYSLEGKYLKSYDSITAAEKAMCGQNNDNIIAIFNSNNKRKSAYGYQWSKIKVAYMPPYTGIKYHTKQVRCKETQRIFNSVKEANAWCGLKNCHSIPDNCTGKRAWGGTHPETGEKLHWEYV